MAVLFLDYANLPADVFESLTTVELEGSDDAPRLQATMDYAQAAVEAGTASTVEIVLPSGTLTLGSSVQVPSDVIIRGAGAELINEADPDAGFTDSATVIVAGEDFAFEPGSVTDNLLSVDSATPEAYLLNLGNSDRVAIEGVGFVGTNLHGAIYGRVNNDFTLSDSVVMDTQWSGVRLFNAREVTIEGTRFHDAGGQKKGNFDEGESGGAIYATFMAEGSVITGNTFTDTRENPGSSHGIKIYQMRDGTVNFNTIDLLGGFAIEMPFGKSEDVEIAHNYFSAAVSIPRSDGGSTEDFAGQSFNVHHNLFTSTYSIEIARDGLLVADNVFAFRPGEEDNKGNLFSGFGNSSGEGPIEFTGNLVLNPGRGVFWSNSVIENLTFTDNRIVVNENGRDTGLFGINGNTDFSGVTIADNVIEVIGSARDLLRNEQSGNATIENNLLINVSDTERYENPQTGEQQGTGPTEPFGVGAGGTITVDPALMLLLTQTGLDPSLAAREQMTGIGTELGDVIEGTDGRDRLIAGAEDDIIFGLGDRDLLNGGSGDDLLFGGDGLDRLYGSGGNDLLFGGEGNDKLYGGAGVDILIGGAGNDHLYVDGDDTVVQGGDGYDRLIVRGDGDVSVDLTGAEIEFARGGTGNDLFDGTGAASRLTLRGGDGGDVMLGGEMTDLLIGDAGDDVLFGGGDRDRLYGSDGADTLAGGDGNDKLYGGEGADSLFGGDGNDILFVDADDLLVDGGDGYDRVVVQGDAGVALDLGARGIEFVRGGIGDDFFDGSDVSFGLSLNGGAGDDFLIGGAGRDFISGNDGADTFVYASGGGQDVIRDFEIGIDMLLFDMTDLPDAEDLSTFVGQRGNNTVFDFGNDDTLILRNVQFADLEDSLILG